MSASRNEKKSKTNANFLTEVRVFLFPEKYCVVQKNDDVEIRAIFICEIF